MDEPFDDLTRRLAAAPMSRRRALVVMAAAAAGATLGIRPSRRASAGHCGTERVCEVRDGTKACWRPAEAGGKPSGDCKCAEGSPGKGEGCVDAKPHCGSSDKPCPGGVPPECKCQ